MTKKNIVKNALVLLITFFICQATALATSVINIVGTGNPNSAIGGKIGQAYFDSTNIVDYVCTTAGNSSTAVWTRKSVPAGTVMYLPTGSSIPAGWILCNGVTQSGVTPPNLIGMLPQGCNPTGTTGNGNASGFDTGGTVTPGTVVGAINFSWAHSHTIVNAYSSSYEYTASAGTSSTSTSSAGGTQSLQPSAIAMIPIMKL